MQASILRKCLPAALLVTFFASIGGSVFLQAQEGCRAPTPPIRAHELNIFSEQQEMDLGDAMSEHLQGNFRVSNDEQFVGYLRQIADRLLKHMPATHLRLQLFLVDLPNANAFDLAGGRVYVSLKLVALARNEDELAGVLAHELGHMVVHQGALDMTRHLSRALKVTEVSDRRDVFDKYYQLIQTVWRKLGALSRTQNEEEQEQKIADRLALYAVAGAGYSVDSFPEIFDRIAGTKGKTGNWLTDFFGSTNVDSRRLREMIKTAGVIPEACIDRTAKPSGDYFKTWQAKVIENSNWTSQELLHGVLSKTQLNPRLRGEIRHLKFSPDGHCILAQDEGNIYVLTRQPFATLFQINARDAAPAQFSPDSKSVVFHNSGLRVESWSIAARNRTSAHELVVQKGCWQADLSPDGKVLACLEGRTDLVMIDVASGDELFRKPAFARPSVPGLAILAVYEELQSLFLHIDSIFEQFSPDARYFLARSNVSTLLIDLTSHEAIPLPGALNRHLTGGFAFLGTNRVVAVNGDNPAKSHVLAFPSGEILADVSVGSASLTTATRGDYVMLRPVEDYPVGVIDLAAGKHLFANRRSALDIFDQVFVAEARDAQVALLDLHNRQPLAMASLPPGRLGLLKARAVSPDWKWLAASEEGRGAVWNLENGNRLYLTRGFQGGYFSDDGRLYADFPKYKEKDRQIAILALSAPQISDGVKVEEKHAQQYGDLLILMKPENKPGWKELRGNVTWEIVDARTGTKLWSRYFPKEAPSMAVDSREGTMVLCWDASSSAAREEIKNFPAVGESLSSRKEKANAFLVEVLEARTGKSLGSLAVDAGSRFLNIKDAHASRKWVSISDPNNRVLLYSLSSGKEVGRFFGSRATLSTSSGLLCVENEDGHLTLYDVNSGQDLDRWVFSSPIAIQDFSPDGKRLFVLTADQTAYVLDVSLFFPSHLASAAGPGQQEGAFENPQN